MGDMELLIYVLFAAVIGGIVAVCLIADSAKQRRKRRYDDEMATWHQNEYLRKIAEQGQAGSTPSGS